MEEKIVKVKANNISISPLKLRLVVDTVRGKSVEDALNILELLNKKGVVSVRKAILSGVANARDLYSADKEDLKIKHISVDEAPTLKRVRFASRGRVSRIKKRRSNINLELKVK